MPPRLTRTPPVSLLETFQAHMATRAGFEEGADDSDVSRRAAILVLEELDARVYLPLVLDRLAPALRGPEPRATAAFDFIRALLAVPPSHSGQPWPWDDPPEPPDQVAPRDHALSLLWEAANAGPVYRYPADRTGWAVMRAVGRVDARAFWAELFRELDEAPHG